MTSGIHTHTISLNKGIGIKGDEAKQSQLKKEIEHHNICDPSSVPIDKNQFKKSIENIHRL